MKTSDKESVQEIVENEGLDYAMFNYSDFKEIKDTKFHELRQQYIDSAKVLAEYIGVEI